jgi:hypothetical protein
MLDGCEERSMRATPSMMISRRTRLAARYASVVLWPNCAMGWTP